MLILHHARIYSDLSTNRTCQAVAIENDQIIAIGTNSEILNLFRPGSTAENMEGKTILPGLMDGHLHLENYGKSLSIIDCETTTKSECLERVRDRVRQSQPDEWIMGHGWNQNEWHEGYGTVEELDAIAPHNPVVLTAKSLHAMWVNSLALKKCSIHKNMPDPVDGKFGRYPSGELNGILFESTMNSVYSAMPKPTLEESIRYIHVAQENLWKLGITGVHDFDPVSCFRALQYLDTENQLKLRVIKGIPLDFLEEAVNIGLKTGFGSPMLKIGPAKLFMDGALGPQTAAMFEPYENSQQTGILSLDQESVFEYGKKASQSGLSLATHAIGDRANHEAILAYQKLRDYENHHRLPHLRHRIEHVQLLTEKDFDQFFKLEIIASMQPIHATSDMDIAEKFWGTRASNAYAFKTLLGKKATLSFGSDAPVESPNPFLGIHAAVTRCRKDGTPSSDGWYPQQRIDLKSAFTAYTIGSAIAGNIENISGKLLPGFYADLIVLAEDPFLIPPQNLYQIKPTSTMISGQWVWKS